MAINTDTEPFKKRKNASIFLFDEQEPQSLQEKRQAVLDAIFNTRARATYNDPQGNQQRITTAIIPSEDNQGQNNASNAYEVPESVQEKRQAVLDAIKRQKLNAEDYQQQEPDAPEFDSNRYKKAKNISTVAFIAQGIDALTDAIGLARTDDTGNYQTAPARGDQLGIEAYNKLAELDYDYKKNLQNYKQNVFTTKQANRQSSQRIAEFNQGVDANVAKQELNWALQDEQAKATAEKAKQEAQAETKNADREAYLDAGNRLISQGQERAAMVAFSKAGLPSDEIAAMLQNKKTGGGKGNGSEPDPTIQNMINRYHALEDELGEGAFGPDGTPITAKAKEHEYLKKELGRERYNPIYQNNSIKKTGGDDSESLISAKNKAAMQQGLDVDNVKKGLNRPEAMISENRELAQKVRSAKSQKEQRDYVAQLMKNWDQQGFNEKEIQQNLDDLFGEYSNDEAKTTGASSNQEEPVPGGGAASNQKVSKEVSGDDPVNTGKISDAIHSFGDWLSNEDLHHDSYNKGPFAQLGRWLKRTSAGSQIETLAYQASLKAKKGEDYSDISAKIQQYAANNGVDIPEDYLKKYIASQK